jgi:hypothetical protein
MIPALIWREDKMKTQNTLLAIAAVSSLAPLMASAANFVGGTYSSSCRYPYPLSTYQGCSDYTHAGSEAAECARDQAFENCRNEYNSDCIEVGVTYREIVSLEFIGYKACEATVLVHGFRRAN